MINDMIKTTIYRHNDGSSRMKVWVDQDKMTSEEISPVGADLIMYTSIPKDSVEYLKTQTKDKVSEYLASYLP
jgi:hypothetical protein